MESIVEQRPADGEAQMLLAEVYGELDLIRNMNMTLDIVRKLSPKYEDRADFIRKKYWIKNFKSGYEHLQNKEFEQAIFKFEMVVWLDSIRTDGYQRLGDAYFLTGRYYNAARAYQKVLEQQPEKVVVKNNLAEIYYLQKAYDKAIDLSNEILVSNPNDLNALLRRAYSYDALNKFKEAEQAFLEVLTLQSRPEVMQDLGLLYFRNENYKKAIAQFTRALERSDDKVLLYRYLGETNRLARNYIAMAQWYMKILESDPDDLKSWKNLAIAYEAMGARDKLLEARNQISKLESMN